MRLFKNFEPGANAMERSQKHSQSKKSTKGLRPPKEHLSASEIRSKVSEHFAPKPTQEDKVEVSKLAKAKNAPAKEVEEEKEAPEKPSDVGLNNPNDPATVGKLKSVLTKGAFNFNPKEREALEKILADRD